MPGTAHTTGWIATTALAAMLCSVLVFAAGCASESFQRTSAAGSTTPMQPVQLNSQRAEPAQELTDAAQPVRTSEQTDVDVIVPGEDLEQESPSSVARATLSPALQRIIDEVEASIARCPRSRALEPTVSLARLRNMSHATAREFDALRERLAELLSAAASTSGSELRFVTTEDEPASFDVLGAAYLATIEGFDSWELYLSVSRRESAHDLWRSEGPVRVLRFEQPMSAQVFYGGATRR